MSPSPVFMSRRAIAASIKTTVSELSLAEMFPPILPPLTPLRTIAAANIAQLNNAMSDLKAGDLVNVSAFDVSGELSLLNKNLASPARFIFAPGWRAIGAVAGSRLPAIYMNECSNIQCIGGDVTGAGNQGVRMDSCRNILWHGVNIHDTAGTGLMVQGLTRASTGIDIEAKISNCGLDLTLDPHAEAGTGNHACYIGEDSYPVSGKFVLDVHDQIYGAALELGQSNNVELWIRGVRILKEASIQVGGNVLQLWGNVSTLTVHYLEGMTLGGRAVETDGLSSISGSVVEYGRVYDYRLSPPYSVHTGITYQNCL